MIYSKVIIVGGGPAGSSCAWKLKENNIDCIVLDHEKFPRTKLCAGWITPKVFKILKLDDYPRSFVTYDRIYVHFLGMRLRSKTRQHSIRRYEFDDWLLKRSGAKVYNHKVMNIKKQGEYYIIDGKYKCKYLVGAGGTYCPVYRTFFEKINPRSKRQLVVCMEQEFKCDYKNKDCLLWFFENKLFGYSWYVPKGDGYLNIGIGGFFGNKKVNIKKQWNYFTKKLKKMKLIENYDLDPKGYIYYVRGNIKKYHIDNAFLVGDAAGLATKDLAEGIGPAVESGILAADSIINGTRFSLGSLKKNSCPSITSIFIKLGARINQLI